MVTLSPVLRSAGRYGPAMLLALALGPAQAADLPLRASLPPQIELPPPPPAPDWSGFSVGIDGGHVWAGEQALRNAGTTPLEQMLVEVGNVGRVKMPTSSFVMRGGLGYDLQLSPGSGFVFGVAADALYTNLQRSRTASFSFGGNDITLQARQNLDFLGTVRGRLGYALGPVLVYGTGGFAYGGADFQAQTNIANPAYSGIYDGGRHQGIETGTVYGGGLEWMADGLMPSIAPGRLAFKIEYLRYDLGKRTVSVNGSGPVFGPGGLTPIGHTANSTFRTDGQFVSAGLTYRFSGGAY